MRRYLILLAALAAACGTDLPEPEPAALIPHGDTLHVPLEQATDGAWLGGERFALVSPADNRVAILDFAAGDVRMLPTGDDQVLNPSLLFALADTLFVSDWGRRLVTAWAEGARLTRELGPSPAAQGALPRAIDGQGRLYFEVAPDPGPDGRGNQDSASVVMVTPDEAGADTVARLGPLDVARVATDQGDRWQRRVFSGDDEWGVLPDGSVWVARYYHNRVDWRGPDGAWREGARLFDRVLEVTQVDRDRFVSQFPQELENSAELLTFAPLKPPFTRGFTGGDGRAWLEKSRHVADTMQLYHVVNRDGTLAAEVQVPGWGRILAASPDHALVLRTDSAGYRVSRAALALPSRPAAP